MPKNGLETSVYRENVRYLRRKSTTRVGGDGRGVRETFISMYVFTRSLDFPVK
jgi:hypothetical protein